MSETSYPPPPGKTDGRATAALVVGIIALVLSVLFFPLGVLLGIVALVLGLVSRSSGSGRAIAGIVTGAVAIVIGVLIGVFVGNFIADNADEISDLGECLEQAEDDAAREDCNQRFQEQLEN